jgi:uncharacterized metal-binding protein
MSNHIGIWLDRRGLAEMSYIAGVGGEVPRLTRIAKSGRPIIALDGCALACVKNSRTAWVGGGALLSSFRYWFT